MEPQIEHLQYPIGRLVKPLEVLETEIHQAIQTLSDFPGRIQKAVEKLEKNQLDTPYRPDGWTVRQVVHHCADSHTNAYIRFKWALTEDNPTIKTYDQGRWASLIDSQMLPPDVSLEMIRAIHARWVTIMNSMADTDWERTFIHPEHNSAQSLKQVVKMYEWHAGHHLAHITGLIDRMGWDK